LDKQNYQGNDRVRAEHSAEDAEIVIYSKALILDGNQREISVSNLVELGNI